MPGLTRPGPFPSGACSPLPLRRNRQGASTDPGEDSERPERDHLARAAGGLKREGRTFVRMRGVPAGGRRGRRLLRRPWSLDSRVLPQLAPRTPPPFGGESTQEAAFRTALGGGGSGRAASRSPHYAPIVGTHATRGRRDPLGCLPNAAQTTGQVSCSGHRVSVRWCFYRPEAAAPGRLKLHASSQSRPPGKVGHPRS